MGEFSSSLCIVYIGTTKHQCHFIVLSYQSHKIIISQIKWFECSIQFCIKNTVQKKVITLNKRLHEKKVTQSCALKLSTFFSTSTQSLLNKDKNRTESFQHQSTDFMAMLLTNATPVSQRAVCVIWNTGTFSKNHLPKK